MLLLCQAVRGKRRVLGQVRGRHQKILEIAVHQHAADLLARHQALAGLQKGGGE